MLFRILKFLFFPPDVGLDEVFFGRIHILSSHQIFKETIQSTLDQHYYEKPKSTVLFTENVKFLITSDGVIQPNHPLIPKSIFLKFINKINFIKVHFYQHPSGKYIVICRYRNH